MLGEKLVIASKLPFTIIRPSHIYGPGSTGWVLKIAELVSCGKMVLLDNGKHRAGLVHVDDVVAAMLQCVALFKSSSVKSNTVNQIYNICSEDKVFW